MHAHARLRVERTVSADGVPGVRIARLRSEGALVLRPTREALPDWTRRRHIDVRTAATVRLAAGAAGPLGGDHWRLDIEVAQGATLMLTSVAAQVVLPGAHGDRSCNDVHIRVADGGTLIWLPGTQIAAAGCRHRGFTRIDLAGDARLYAREELLTGRHGEPSGSICQRIRVLRAGIAVHDQEVAVGPEHPGWQGSAVTGGRHALGSTVLVEPEPGRLDCLGAAVASERPDTAVMRLSDCAAVVNALAPDTVTLRDRMRAALAPYESRQEAVEALSGAAVPSPRG